ncbi:hypothetical protein O9993_09545 [Vibrio lentus]|nr:hypothetical protein [Vibrio lentus]
MAPARPTVAKEHQHKRVLQGQGKLKIKAVKVQGCNSKSDQSNTDNGLWDLMHENRKLCIDEADLKQAPIAIRKVPSGQLKLIDSYNYILRSHLP